jgi:hypothetical protein
MLAHNLGLALIICLATLFTLSFQAQHVLGDSGRPETINAAALENGGDVN